ncbi:transmembrane 220 family protein [Fibrella sp. HMF5335]|uniref:Transmembrane 220 family protein n=1 Tax=Fibrella rubiginis TaxID=2817060 RepID=A0A939K6K9_9BACT|nr:transmembrane 220 family protein [Fibrella rubiginis]MBO0938441.1 transmembrane 220 family protein [Fibrella rubiginis]
MKPLSLLFAGLFVLFAAVQYNDPDPQVWIPIYAFAAMACVMAYAGLGRSWFFVLMALIYAGAAVWQWPPTFEGFLLNEVGMKTVNIELAREAGGLAICTIAMFTLAWLTRRRA